jgi:hypothetical protein
MVFNATFNNISVISWRSAFYCWRKAEYQDKTTDLPQVTDKLCIYMYMYIKLNMDKEYYLTDLKIKNF